MHLSYYKFISSFLDLSFWLTWLSRRPFFWDFDLTYFDLFSPNEIQVILRLFIVIDMYYQLCKKSFIVIFKCENF